MEIVGRGGRKVFYKERNRNREIKEGRDFEVIKILISGSWGWGFDFANFNKGWEIGVAKR